MIRERVRGNRHSNLDDYAHVLRDHAEESRDEARQARELLHWGPAQLKPVEQMVITLLELQELTVREVAGITGWRETNVKVRVHRARKTLKRVVGGER